MILAEQDGACFTVAPGPYQGPSDAQGPQACYGDLLKDCFTLGHDSHELSPFDLRIWFLPSAPSNLVKARPAGAQQLTRFQGASLSPEHPVHDGNPAALCLTESCSRMQLLLWSHFPGTRVLAEFVTICSLCTLAAQLHPGLNHHQEPGNGLFTLRCAAF